MNVTNDTHLVYLVEGEPYAGTLKDYVHAVEEGHYSGLDVSVHVWVFDHGQPVRRFPRWDTSPYSEELYACVSYRLGEAEACFTLDGAA